MELTGPKIRYLVIIYRLWRENASVRSVDISIRLGVARPSVHRMLASLSRMGLIDMKPRGSIKLTEAGLREAERYDERYQLIFPFFEEVIGLSDFDAEQSALAALACLPERCVDALCRKYGQKTDINR